MRRLFVPLFLLALHLSAAPAESSFGLKDLDISIAGENSTPALLAGSHPFAMTTKISLNTTQDPKAGEVPDGAAKDVIIELPPGLVADPTAVSPCPAITFIESATGGTPCPNASVIGTTTVEINEPGENFAASVYSLDPPPGSLMKFGFIVLSNPVTVEVGVNPKPPFNGIVSVSNISQAVTFYSSETTIWGTPASQAHDSERGICLQHPGTLCSVDSAPRPFLTLPGSCSGPLSARFKADSWALPGVFDEPFPVLVHGESEVPGPPSGCGTLLFKPAVDAEPTAHASSSASGLEFSVDVDDEGLKNSSGRAQSQIKEAIVTLPEGFTANPSVASGLVGCQEADLERESADRASGGCPDASKIGTVEVESPLLRESLEGSVYVASPYENPFGSLLALYMVIRNEELGILIARPLKVETDPVTGRITTAAKDLPQLPFSHFTLNLRQGARSPLASPPACGAYDPEADLVPWSGGAPVHTTSVFEITTGPNGGPCPVGTPFLKPALVAGTVNNSARHFSPFDLQLSRSDAEEEISRLSIELPPGLVARVADIPFCSDGAIEAARARTGPHGGQEELEAPSCPQASEIGHTLVGAGVGASPAYVPGKLYLAGPYRGSPLSVVAITPAKVGPFDLGSVVVREALNIDPVTAEVSIDAVGSDPLPRIIKGIPVHLRDIRIHADRPEFVLNPTSCKRTSIDVIVGGAGLTLGSDAGGASVAVSTPFQAADCASLGFKPRIGLSLTGGTRRGAHPALRAVLRPRAGDANPSSLSVLLPHSEFLEQAHIRTVCTRVQFRAGAGHGSRCPAGAVYGRARAWTPLLAEPLEGPVFLRSSDHPLPDLVVALHGLIDVEAVGRISSVRSRIRNSFDFIPDAPISKVVVDLQGGKKGLLVNSTNICMGPHRARVKFSAHNGRSHRVRPKLRAQCGEGRGGKKHQSKRGPAD